MPKANNVKAALTKEIKSVSLTLASLKNPKGAKMPSRASRLLLCLIAFISFSQWPFSRWTNLLKATRTVAETKHHRLILKPLRSCGLGVWQTPAQPQIRGPPCQLAHFATHETRAVFDASLFFNLISYIMELI
ncbi:MAG TPA: hypothetical protein PKZ02_00560 [Candidatus Paceibacterota bacterium]|nr:hypothetical protein [Candidatus Paceibacterota bacterium]